jgi:TrpR-related protein YerC/YecD
MLAFHHADTLSRAMETPRLEPLMKRRFTEDSWRKEPWFKGLTAAFRACRTDEEIGDFLRDVATLSELQAMSERLEVARLLGRGLSYRQVAAQTGASTTTVTRVAHFLENGEGGYRKVLGVHRHHRIAKQNPALERPAPANRDAEDATERRPRHVSPLQKYLDRPDSGPDEQKM